MGTTSTRWEKAVEGLDDIVTQVSKFDTDGVDIVCSGGEENSERYYNVKGAGWTRSYKEYTDKR